MSSNRPGGMKCRIQRLLCLLFIQWGPFGLSVLGHAFTSDLKSVYQRNDNLPQEAFFFTNSYGHQQRGLLDVSSFVSAAPSYPAIAPVSPTDGAPTPVPIPALFPSNPPETVPYSPAPGSSMVPTGNCSINFTSIEATYYQTAGDCVDPVAEVVGVVICCPQFSSLVRIMQGQHIAATGSLGLNDTDAGDCLSETLSAINTNGLIPGLCNVEPANFTVGSCPITTVTEFELVVNTTSLLEACQDIDQRKECTARTCQNEIGNATLRLAEGHLDKMADCESLVVSYFASKSTPEVANSVLRFLSSCNVNSVCPLTFSNTSLVADACASPIQNSTTCCSAVELYAQTKLQKQMLITNQQAYKCASTLGFMLQDQGVTDDIYSLCKIDLRDFSLQAQGREGCLLSSQPTDINITASTIVIICDLNDNILAQWPKNVSLFASPSPSPLLPPSRGTSLYIGMELNIICALAVLVLSVIIL